MREEGYYWIKCGGEWMIAEYIHDSGFDGNHFQRGSLLIFDEDKHNEIEEIDECRIVRGE